VCGGKKISEGDGGISRGAESAAGKQLGKRGDETREESHFRNIGSFGRDRRMCAMNFHRSDHEFQNMAGITELQKNRGEIDSGSDSPGRCGEELKDKAVMTCW
jgi:hypothetical protein